MLKIKEILSYHAGDVHVEFPFLQIKGDRSGPTVTITAGIHGSEYTGIFSTLGLFKELDPKDFKGVLNIIPIANLPAFEARAMFVCPLDDKNPNRCFPGKQDGTYTDALVYHLFHDYIKGSDYYVDLHCGDVVENLLPISIIQRTGNDEVDQKTIELAQCFGLPHIVTSGEKYLGTSNVAASESGVPAIIVEIGGMGQVCTEHVDMATKGLYNVLKHAGCLEGAADLKRNLPQYITYEWVKCSKKGIFYNNCTLGQEVTKGDVLGFVTDYLGNEIEVIYAPVSAKVLIVTTSPAVSENGLLMALGGE